MFQIKTITSMSEPKIRCISMPPTSKHPSGFNLPLKDRVLVVIGANGSGKTRFGAWLDTQDINVHHRMSAHRSLSFPENVQPTDLVEAERKLYFGDVRIDNPAHFRQHIRWQNNPATALLNDFHPLVTLMVSESFSVSDQYRVVMQSESQYKAPPKTRLDMVKQIWESILPSRELVVNGSRFETRNRQNNNIYHAKEMSDGERGVFYLIAEALSVPKNGVFIIDEPELHLHRAIQSRLWDAIEISRPDCTFVYITHNLDFAASRKDATKVWLREYMDGKWDWEEVPEESGLQESMLLEVLGSRKPVLFVEGTRNSLDHFVYGLLFAEYHIVPCESCEVVIHATKSFNALSNLHHISCSGLVDNDGRSADDVAMLERLNVKVLPVALIENLFVSEPVLTLAASRLGFEPKGIVLKVKSRIFELLHKNCVRVISNLTRQEIELKLRRFGKGGDGVEALSDAFTNACAEIKPREIYTRWETEINHVLKDNDYAAALRYYKTKGLSNEASSVFSLKYEDQVKRWLRSENPQEIINALRSAVPTFEVSPRDVTHLTHDPRNPT